MRREGERVILTTGEALGVMDWWVSGGRSVVHTARQGGSVIIGCDWPREDVERWLATHEAGITGPTARRMGHGIGGLDEKGPLMFATNKERLTALEREEGT